MLTSATCLLFLVFSLFSRTLLAGNLQNPLPPFMGNLPPKMNGNYLPTWQMPMCSKLLNDDIEMLANENQTEKHADDFDDDLGFRFGADPEEETDAPLRQNIPEDENEYKLVQLEWNGILKKYVVVVTNFLPMTLKTEGKAPVYDRLDFEEDLEFAEPDKKSICVSLPVKSSSENSYPVKRNGETDDDESSDGSSNSKESEDSGNDASGYIIPSTKNCDSSNSEYFLKTVQITTKDDDCTFIEIFDSHHLNSCNLTELGETELQADNPELFATKEKAIEAFQALKQSKFKKTKHTMEYQAIARLMFKHQHRPVVELIEKHPEMFQTMEDVWSAIHTYKLKKSFEKKKAGEEQAQPSYKNEVLEALISYQKQNPPFQHIFSSTDSDNLKEIVTYPMFYEDFFRCVARALFIHLKPEDDDAELLIICNNDPEGMGTLTSNGATELQENYPDLFPAADFALLVFNELFDRPVPDIKNIDTLQYQAIAKLVQDHVDANSIKSFIVDDEYCCGEPYTKTIPYKMFSSGCLEFGTSDKSFFISKKSEENYEQYCFSKKNFFHLKNFVNNPEMDSDSKIKTISLIFPPDDKELTPKNVFTNIDFLIGDTYKRAESSFNEHSNKRRKLDKQDSPR
ncbi:hypothetical protein [Endozoicomonas euniceicola]|uniref:Uncharacterized protein n=1 Tax=Endozoicomonas euniceicola TaxID=1234143 RepID=A0ABY6GZP8_9GAMM|nr:hypothetical protein [Endozoicomonas euniceicola]UYM17458.1 hypothetical protein NX720_05930 [Endozoicomonas euniceicola]